MKSILYVLIIVIVSCKKECLNDVSRVKNKTNNILNLENMTLNKHLNQVREWQDSLRYFKNKKRHQNHGFDAKYKYEIEKLMTKNSEFIRTHIKIEGVN